MPGATFSKVGDLTLHKGTVRTGIELYAWDSIRPCEPETCPAVDMCNFIKRGKCAVQVKYIETLYNAIFTSYKYMDEITLFRVGMQIIPMYLQLVKMQIIELALPSPIYTTDKGITAVHPVYKEIRNILKTIHEMWKDLELSFSMSLRPEITGKKESGIKNATPTARDFDRGDPDYYDTITKQSEISMKGVVR